MQFLFHLHCVVSPAQQQPNLVSLVIEDGNVVDASDADKEKKVTLASFGPKQGYARWKDLPSGKIPQRRRRRSRSARLHVQKNWYKIGNRAHARRCDDSPRSPRTQSTLHCAKPSVVTPRSMGEIHFSCLLGCLTNVLAGTC